MTYSNAARMQKYQDFGTAALACDASPHRLIAMLYDGAVERLAKAVAGIEQQDLRLKLDGITSTVAILEYLQLVLDRERGDALAVQLHELYDYCRRRLAQANADNDADAVREVMRLVQTVKSGWDEIGLTQAA